MNASNFVKKNPVIEKWVFQKMDVMKQHSVILRICILF